LDLLRLINETLAKQMETERDQARAEAERLEEWKKSVSNICKTLPEFDKRPWTGDKDGWGFHFELIKYIGQDRDLARAEVDHWKDLSKVNYESSKEGWDLYQEAQREVDRWIELAQVAVSDQVVAQREVERLEAQIRRLQVAQGEDFQAAIRRYTKAESERDLAHAAVGQAATLIEAATDEMIKRRANNEGGTVLLTPMRNWTQKWKALTDKAFSIILG